MQKIDVSHRETEFQDLLKNQLEYFLGAHESHDGDIITDAIPHVEILKQLVEKKVAVYEDAISAITKGPLQGGWGYAWLKPALHKLPGTWEKYLRIVAAPLDQATNIIQG